MLADLFIMGEFNTQIEGFTDDAPITPEVENVLRESVRLEATGNINRNRSIFFYDLEFRPYDVRTSERRKYIVRVNYEKEQPVARRVLQLRVIYVWSEVLQDAVRLATLSI